MFSESGVLKLIDFAFADLSRTPGIKFDVPEEEEGAKITIERKQNKDYLPPEVRKGFAPVSKATDIYSIGAIFHWMVTQQAPAHVQGYSESKVKEAFKSINPNLDERLAELVFKATHPDPKQRYVHLTDMASDLRACLSDDSESVVAMHLAVAKDKEDFEVIKERLLGQQLNNYVIEKYLGASLTSMVFSAREKNANTVSALKISHRILSGFEPAKEVVDKRSEVLSFLDHRNIIKLHHIGELGNQEYIYAIREFAEGNRLDKIEFHLKHRRFFGLRNLINLFVKICQGVKSVHDVEFLDMDGEINYGIMHGNLTPKKIYINAKEEVKVADFLFGYFPHIPTLELAIPEEVEQKYKEANSIDYMPPEVVNGIERPTKRTDVYALGAIFYEILTDRKLSQYIPETEYHLFRLLRQRNSRIPRRLSKTIFRTIHPDPYRRFNTVDELIRELMRNTVLFSKLFYRFGHHGLDSKKSD
jgi:serine/threonine-protein kinase